MVTKMALVTIETSALIKAPVAMVWSTLTDPSRARQWCPYWAGATDTQSLAGVGATIAYKDEFGNPGRTVVIHAEPNRDLRVAHAPNDGSYLCQTAFKLAAEGTGTRLTVVEQYSDQMDVPLDKDTAAAAAQSIQSYVLAIKAMVEAR
jgi:uncharacterized protein YndB with AHSA1/START domain